MDRRFGCDSVVAACVLVTATGLLDRTDDPLRRVRLDDDSIDHDLIDRSRMQIADARRMVCGHESVGREGGWYSQPQW